MKLHEFGVLAAGTWAGACPLATLAAFTAAGCLLERGRPANGLFELQFTRFANAYGGQPLSPRFFGLALIRNGLLAFRLHPRPNWLRAGQWLEVAVRRAGSTARFSSLSPRQPFGSGAGSTAASSGGGGGPQAELAILAPGTWPGNRAAAGN